MCSKCDDVKEKLSRKPGDEIIFYLNNIEEGRAVLIEPKLSWSDSVPFPIQESEEGKENCEQVNVVSKTWIVEFFGDKFSPKFRTTRKVLEFHSCGDIAFLEENEDLNY